MTDNESSSPQPQQPFADSSEAEVRGYEKLLIASRIYTFMVVLTIAATIYLSDEMGLGRGIYGALCFISGPHMGPCAVPPSPEFSPA